MRSGEYFVKSSLNSCVKVLSRIKPLGFHSVEIVDPSHISINIHYHRGCLREIYDAAHPQRMMASSLLALGR